MNAHKEKKHGQAKSIVDAIFPCAPRFDKMYDSRMRAVATKCTIRKGEPGVTRKKNAFPTPEKQITANAQKKQTPFPQLKITPKNQQNSFSY